MRIISYQVENVNKDIEITKKNRNRNSGAENCKKWNIKIY